MSKLTGLHAIFPKEMNLQCTHGFPCINVRQVPWEIFKTQDNISGCIEGLFISQSYMDEVCWPAFLVRKNSDCTRHMMLMPEQTTRISKLCALTGQLAHLTCLKFEHVYDIFGQKVQGIIMLSKRITASRCSVS